jgi:selenocysteine lyase/cysteine desulfurase
MDKREFLRAMGGLTLTAVFTPEILARYSALPKEALAEDEKFWAEIRGKYKVTPDYINLENGYFSMQSEPVLEGFIARVREVNLEGAHYMRVRAVDDKLRVRTRLAKMAGCSPEELIITRNTTESLDTIIAGYDWKPGDEAIMAVQDYGAMRDMFKLQGARRGLVSITLTLPNLPQSDDEIVQLYANAITPKTRLLMCCHVVNITGQVLPVAKIADMAHAKGVDVMVDGAHAFAQLDYVIPDTHADYYGASLHKWLGTPIGSGILYVKKEKIKGLWPIFSDYTVPDDDIRKLNHTGTHPSANDLGIEPAMDFHEAIGIQRKEARLRYLQAYWTSRVRGTPNIILNTPEDPKRTCAIANVAIKGMTPAELSKTLLDKYRVYTVAITTPAVMGARITPHLFTTTKEFDVLVSALKEIAAG